MQLLASETGGKSYKAHKFGLDHAERPMIDYGEDSNIWQRIGETTPHKTYIPLKDKSIDLTNRGEQLLTFFLDGSRRVFKVDDIAYIQSGRNVIYPVIAGQIGVGCCKRVDKMISRERFVREIVLSIPENANADGKAGFYASMAMKINNIPELKRAGIEIKKIIPYKISKNSEDKYEDRGTACVQDEMCRMEKEMVAQLVKEDKLDQNNYLIKDGSLEYRPTKDMLKSKHQAEIFKNNYNWVLGVSKNFNPEVCKDIAGKSNPGFIAELPPLSRTPVACFRNPDLFGDMQFAVWYIRLRDAANTRTQFDGIVKVEKMLVTQEENENGMDSDLVDVLSALIINERNPVCYGADLRWANHLYPIYLTESYVKSKYLSTESFLQLF